MQQPIRVFLGLLRAAALALLPILATTMPSQASAATISAAELPARSAPSGMTTADVDGGRMIVSAHTAVTADELGAALRHLHGYFDATPRLLSAVRSSDGHTTIAMFQAALAQHRVSGLLITTVQSGSSVAAWLFADPKSLGAALPAMETHLGALEHRALLASAPAAAHAVAAAPANPGWPAAWITAAQHGSRVELTRVAASDGTESIGLAPGFTASGMQTGNVLARSTDGAVLRIGGFIPAIDPRGNAIFRGGGIAVVQYSPDLATAWRTARYAYAVANNVPPDQDLTVESATPVREIGGKRNGTLFGHITLNGRRTAYEAIVTTSPPGGSTSSWSLQFAALWAPVDHFEADAESLLAMAASYNADMNKVNSIQNAQVGAMIAQSQRESDRQLASNAAFRDKLARNSAIARQQSAEAQDYIQREGASAIHLMKNEDPVAYGSSPNGRHGLVPLGASGDFHSVPISQYQKGIDY